MWQAMPSSIVLQAESGAANIALDWDLTEPLVVNKYRVTRNLIPSESTTMEDDLLDSYYIDYIDSNHTGSNHRAIGETYCYQVEALNGQNVRLSTSNLACAKIGVLTLWAPTTTGKAGDSVTVPVNIRNASGLQLSDSDIWLGFDSALLQFEGVTATPLSQGYDWRADATIAGRLRINATPHDPANPTVLYGAGPLFAKSGPQR